MNATPLSRPLSADVQQLIESLASVICATEQPRTALLTAVARLHREVRDTNQAATSHVSSRRGAC